MKAPSANPNQGCPLMGDLLEHLNPPYGTFWGDGVLRGYGRPEQRVNQTVYPGDFFGEAGYAWICVKR